MFIFILIWKISKLSVWRSCCYKIRICDSLNLKVEKYATHFYGIIFKDHSCKKTFRVEIGALKNSDFHENLSRKDNADSYLLVHLKLVSFQIVGFPKFTIKIE